MKRLCLPFLCCLSILGSSQNLRSFASDIDPTRIQIVRDVYGVPHIFAETDAEVAYGLAWAHAEDDFATIQKSFLASRSMLGEHNGRHGATIDYIVHLLRVRELVQDKYESDISPAFKAVLQGYCDGLNAYALTNPKEILEKKAFPVTPQDLLTYSVLQMAIGCGVEDALKQIYKGKVSLADFEVSGSNAFAFNSKKTADGNVFLAINTHHPLEGQISWYEVHLSSNEGLNIIGALFPGSPVIFTGVNEHLGWTHTVNYPDRLDVYQLEVRPGNSLEYKVDNQWHTLEETTVKLKVNVPGFNIPIKRKAYWSIYGPTVITERGVFAIRTGALMDIRGLEQWYWMGKAKNFSQFKKALKMAAIPGYNVMYGDRYDTIYYLSNGKLPMRKPGFNWKATVPGNTSATLWTSFHALETLPQILNPSSGYLFNVNHSPFKATDGKNNIDERDYDPTMGYETHENNRSVRVRELLGEMPTLTFDDFKKIKYDLQLPRQLHYPVDIDALFRLDQGLYPDISELIVALKNWDRKATFESTGATVFATAFYQIAAKYEADKTFTLLTDEMSVEVLRTAKAHLLKHFGTTEVPLGEFQRLERGGKSLPLAGLPDVLATMYSKPAENGRMKGSLGECYIALIKFTPQGPEIETINAYGASNRKHSPHYSDQMELFQRQKTKRMTLDATEVYRQAETIYFPDVHPKTLTLKLDARRSGG
jgi:acyl-homoserine-lactone acylase